MVAPITGPLTRTLPSQSFPTGTIFAGKQMNTGSRTWYRQKRPYNLPLTYSSSRVDMGYVYGANIGSPTARPLHTGLVWISNPNSSSSNAYNQAWSQFDEQVRGQTGWATTIVQYRKTYDSLVNNITDLYHVFRDIRQLRFDRLYRRFRPPKRFKMKGKKFADRVLEWRFGWQPLWDDIHKTASALGRDFDDKVVVGKSRCSWREVATFTLSGTYAAVVETRTANVSQAYRLAAKVRITNPNALLFESLGFANPALVAYEVIPFSFVANYFFSLEEYLRGLSPYMGVSLIDPYTSCLVRTDTILAGRLTRWSYPYPNPGNYACWGKGMTFTRTPGAIAGPKLRMRDPWILSPMRGLTSISLLLQQLAKR